VTNIAAFPKPRSYTSLLRDVSSLQPPESAGTSRSSRSRSQRSLIDDAIQQEFMGDGIGLDAAVEARREAGWAVRQRHVQKNDVGHCCHACRRPLRDLHEEVTIWTGAAIYRRFHPACAASYVLKIDRAHLGGRQGCGDESIADVVEGYADGWRALGQHDTGRPSRAVDAARRWLLSQDPSAWQPLRGDLFTTVTVVENGRKKAVPGLDHGQLQKLLVCCRYHGEASCQPSESETGGENVFECAICFLTPDPLETSCIALPCAQQHVFHQECVLPWLRKASICPVCRKDLRPLLSSL